MNKIKNTVYGILIGFINMLIGSCGGIVAVEALKADRLNQTKAHATAIAVILPLTIISSVMYLIQGNMKIHDANIYIIPGMLGSIFGGIILPKISNKTLGKFFSIFIIYAGIRMMLK